MSRLRPVTDRHSQVLCVLALVASLGATQLQAEVRNCALVDGVLPEGCVHDNAGVLVRRPIPASAGSVSAGNLGETGFSISIDASATQPRRHVAGDSEVTERLARVDRTLADMGLRVTVDGLGARPILNVVTLDSRLGYRTGDPVRFRNWTNYPAWIERAEIVVLDPRQPSRPVAIVPTVPNATVDWTMPEDAPREMIFILRVYDSQGRSDETVPLRLLRGDEGFTAAEITGSTPAMDVGEDRTARRRIPVRGGAITVSGTQLPAGGSLSLMGEPVVPDIRQTFVIQRILPPGTHAVTINAGNQSQVRSVTIPHREIFATGIVDITLGRDYAADEIWRFGRLAGFVDAVYGNGVRLTASVDTRDTEFRDMFRHFTRRYPDQLLRSIEDRDVWVTTGDDSRTADLAPTSGRFYLRIERDNNHLMWGDFRPDGDLARVVRTDRTLYGASGRFETSDTLPDGRARASITGYAAQIDRLTQRDVFRGTGGSTYFLTRRDIEPATETLIVEVRDPVSGRLISSTRLIEGRDYRIDYLQGVVILSAPLSPTTSGGGLWTDRPFGDYDVNLVVQYDYVPAAGAVLTDTYGGRAEAWITPQLRLGASGSRETTGTADNTLVGADILLQSHDGTYLRIDAARSEGPGISTRPSLTGGLDLDPEEVAAGVRGQRALGIRAEGRVDLADLGGDGFLRGWYESRAAGFWSPDYNALEAQSSTGVEGAIGLGQVRLTFGAEDARQGTNRIVRRARIGMETPIGDNLTLSLEAAQRSESNLSAGAPARSNGTRTDVAARVTWDAAEDARFWVFGQATMRRTGDLPQDNRIGVGAEVDLTEALALSAEVSTGVLGIAGRMGMTYRPDPASSYRLGLRDDRTQSHDPESAARRSLSLGADRTINDSWSWNAETVLGGIHNRRSLMSTYGLTYRPSDGRAYSAGVLTGETRERDGTTVEREGISLGLTQSDEAGAAYRIRAEYRRDRSDNPARFTRRQSWLVSGALSYQTSELWRLLADLDLVLSNGDGATIRDGRYVEGRLGYAYRPVDDDRLNALLSYTFLDDQPGADQVNIDGNMDGPQQRSHIVNLALSYDIDERWTLGLKYGFRHREETDRITGGSTRSIGHLGVVRVDYRLAHRWDVLGEVRAFHAPRASTTEYGALLGLYREVNPNARIGVGYAWGGVSDDLRRIERPREGVFLNVIGRF
jgi:hypothetical protein